MGRFPLNDKEAGSAATDGWFHEIVNRIRGGCLVVGQDSAVNNIKSMTRIPVVAHGPLDQYIMEQHQHQHQQQQEISRKFRSHAINSYEFDRFLQYKDMYAWLSAIAQKYPHLVAITSYGKSFAGRDLLLATVTETIETTAFGDASNSSSSVEQAASKKPAHWIDANIHSTEVTSGVAALYLIQYLVVGYEQGVQVVVEALRTRAFYIAPRVNPDGVEAALADRPMYHRSSVRPWPYSDGYRWSGLHAGEDIDGDGRILTMLLPIQMVHG